MQIRLKRLAKLQQQAEEQKRLQQEQQQQQQKETATSSNNNTTTTIPTPLPVIQDSPLQQKPKEPKSVPAKQPIIKEVNNKNNKKDPVEFVLLCFLLSCAL